MDYTSQSPKDPTQVSPDTPKINLKQCSSCWVKQPYIGYAKSKYGKDGLSASCKDCRSQVLRLFRKEKYNAKPRSDKDDVIRSVYHHNLKLVEIGLANISIGATFSCVGFVPYTDIRFKVDFGKSSICGLPSMAFYGLDGNFYKEMLFSTKGYGTKSIVNQVVGFLKEDMVRLELSDMYVDYMIKNVYV